MRVRVLVMIFALLAGLVMAEEKQPQPITFYHESYETPALEELRNRCEFDEYVAAGASEFEQMLLLKEWVFEKVDFRHNYALGNLRNTLDILSLSESGASFHCSHFAAVYMQTAVAMGWTARYMFVRNPREEEHATNEIWSNEWSKWILIDVTWNLHIEKDGVPLSALEIRREWLANNGQDLVYVFGAGDNEIRYTARDFPIERTDNNAWLWWPIDDVFMTYTYEMAFVARNNFFSHGDGSGAAIWDEIVVLRDEVNQDDLRWSFRNRPNVTDMRSLYHDVNRVDIASCELDSRTTMLKLDAFGPYNYTPNFAEYLVRVGEGPWEVSEGMVTLQGRERKKPVEARIRNKFGVLGPITTYHRP